MRKAFGGRTERNEPKAQQTLIWNFASLDIVRYDWIWGARFRFSRLKYKSVGPNLVHQTWMMLEQAALENLRIVSWSSRSENGESDWSAVPSLQRLADVQEGGVKSLLGVEKQVFDCFWPNSVPIIYGNTIVNSGLEKACSRRWNPREAILIKDPNNFFKKRTPLFTWRGREGGFNGVR